MLTAILDKDTIASQPTLSRFWNRMDEDTLAQLDMIQSEMRDIAYSIRKPEHMLFDLDSMLLNTYGTQKGEGFNFHYQAHGYHPLLCYDGLTGDLLKSEPRDGTQYCSKDADQFIIPLMQEYRIKYPSLPLYLRGDSGFASPELYKACEENDCKYAIRLKQNSTLIKYASDADDALYRATRENQVDYAVEYGGLRNPITRWYICIPLLLQQWRQHRIRSFSFTAPVARWRTSSRKENPGLLSPLCAAISGWSMQTACRYILLPATCLIDSDVWYYPQA